MTPRKINLVLRIAALSTGALAVVVVITGVALPIQLPALQGRTVTVSSSTAAPSMATLPPLSTFSGVWGHRLRRPLEEMASRPQAVRAAAFSPAAAAAPPPMTLVGTIGTSLAMLRMADGSTAVIAVGEQLDGTEVLAVRFAAVDVRFGGRTVTLEKPIDAVSPFVVVEPGDSSHEIGPAAH